MKSVYICKYVLSHSIPIQFTCNFINDRYGISQFNKHSLYKLVFDAYFVRLIVSVCQFSIFNYPYINGFSVQCRKNIQKFSGFSIFGFLLDLFRGYTLLNISKADQFFSANILETGGHSFFTYRSKNNIEGDHAHDIYALISQMYLQSSI